MPDDTEVAELITMLVRFRTQAVTAVAATLAFSIESAVESTVAQMLGDLIDEDRRSQRRVEPSSRLLPLDGAGRLAGDVEHHAVHLAAPRW